MADPSGKKVEQTNRDGATGYQTVVEGGTAYVGGMHYHGSDVQEAQVIDFAPYLQSIREDEDYLEWDEVYTATTVEGRKKTSEKKTPEKRFSRRLKLRAETVVPQKDEIGDRDADPQPREETEQWDVLAGLRNYAAEHVLLIGKPGSGKSTSLERLLWEAAGRALEEPSAQVPVLVKLRRCTSTIEQLIQDAFSGHGLRLDMAEVAQLLGQGRLLVLLDGLNELPDDFRTKAANFRDRYRKTTPMIVSTRDLAVGGTLGIDKTLKMLPLTGPQMQEFVRGYLGEEGEPLLRQIKGDRLRKFAETPLLLWMLCRVFAQSGSVPSNLGLAFREFTQLYDQQIQADAPAESREQWPRLLRHLAFALMHDEKSVVEFRLSMPREEAEALLTDCLTEEGRADARGCAERWLKDLLDYHLLQLVNLVNLEEYVEFHHQLIQEYYAAEHLLRLLPKLSPRDLQQAYLNYLKWTEPLKLLSELICDESKVVEITRLALKTDLKLGAMLAGAVRPEFQVKTVQQVTKLSFSSESTVYLLGLTKSELAVRGIIQALEHQEISVRRRATEALGKMQSKAATGGLLKALDDQDSSVRKRAAEALGQMRSEAALDKLLKALDGKDSSIRRRAVTVLGQMQSETAIDGLLKALDDQDSSVRWRAVAVLGQMRSEAAIDSLIKALDDQDSSVRWIAAATLGQMHSEAAIDSLLKALDDQDCSIRWRAAEALGQMQSDAATDGLFKALDDQDSYVRRRAAEALGQMQAEVNVGGLLKALDDQDSYVRWRAVTVLGQMRSKAAIDGLLKALEHQDYSIRERAAEALRKIQAEVNIDGLLKALDDQDSYIRWRAIAALGQIQSKAAIDRLLRALDDQDSFVRWRAIAALGQMRSKAAIDGLLKALDDQDSSVRRRAVAALGQIQSKAAIGGLLKALDDQHHYVRSSAAEAIGSIGSSETLKALNKIVLQRDRIDLLDTISAIQAKCKFYNYEIFYNLTSKGKSISLHITSTICDSEGVEPYHPLQTQLTNHLTPLKRQNLITISSQDQIPPGSDRAQTIHQQIHTADIILLLITPDALADEACYQQEILPAIQRHKTGQAHTIPILLRPTDYIGEPFSQLDILPKNHQPITTWDNQDEAFREIAEAIRELAIQIRRKQGDH